MDQFELDILEALAEDARTPIESIARMTGKSVVEVAQVIEKLEKNRVIIRYPAMINWEALDKELVEALIEVRVSPQRGVGFDAIAEEIYRFDEVTSVYLMSGAYDLLVMVKGHSLKKLAEFVSEKLSTLDHVLSTATHFVLKKYKENGYMLTGEPRDDRLAVSP